MGTTLYQHNQTAYEAALGMLRKTGKAAVIHPTGTGKSFLALKLCEDHPEDPVCWLSPSEYIFRTQEENWLAAGGGELPNIRFFTYAKLMLMNEEELAEVQPRYIVLDEFHRCGAALWGQGVQRLLRMYPEAFLLGLTATSIRYLDNQRDMADELFDGNIASEISLGDAIVRGILNPPKYVLSVYSYQKDMERLQERIRRTKNRAVRDAAETYLEALRRTLEKADGLDVIFDRHMPDRTGKYIVFCSNAEHMREMMGLSAEWFGRIDKHPHVYSVYSSDPSASRSFAEFKSDDDREHLRLLYCIDALNEGIHLEDISGVILLRPTVSPIVFKQQIGRALSASKKKDAVIFDIVLNINNLYSIGAVEEEMQTAAAYYRSLGESDEIVQEHFRIIDEVQDCRMLFEKLGEVLTTSWSVMYEQAQQYYRENGNLEVPARYVTADGYSLGHWIYNQRYIRKGTLDGSLTEEKIAKLDAIGMRWNVLADAGWEKNFAAAQKYYEEYGNLDVPAKYRAEDGTALGQWLSSLRTWEKAGVHPKYLTGERKEQLENIGMVWDKFDRIWERNYAAAQKYYEEHGNLDVPSSYVDAEGIRLGAWISRMRKLRPGAKKAAVCEGVADREKRQDALLTQGQTEYGEEPLAREQTVCRNALQLQGQTEYGKKLQLQGQTVCRKVQTSQGQTVCREAPPVHEQNVCREVLKPQKQSVRGEEMQLQGQTVCREALLSQEQVERLDAIGMVWEKRTDQAWERSFRAAEQYALEHGDLLIPASYETADGLKLGAWIQRQRLLYKKNAVSADRVRRLEEAGMVWDTQPWMKRFSLAEKYCREHGTDWIPQNYVEEGCWVGKWLAVQKRMRAEGRLTVEQREMLASLERFSQAG